ncbi:MAG: energy transducer TonB [Pseudomonadota bacterium]
MSTLSMSAPTAARLPGTGPAQVRRAGRTARRSQVARVAVPPTTVKLQTPAAGRSLRRRLPGSWLAWGGVVLLAHLGGVWLMGQGVPAERPLVSQEIELIRPPVAPPQVEAPPPPPVPHPMAATPSPRATAPATRAPRPQPLQAPAPPSTLQAPATAPDADSVAAASPQEVPEAAPATAAASEPAVVEASGRAGYRSNPAPTYPEMAQRQGWQGKVVLRVLVLPSGQPASVEVKQSSGRNVLDQAALSAVKQWTFEPSRRGSTPIEGWATVPIDFKLAS